MWECWAVGFLHIGEYTQAHVRMQRAATLFKSFAEKTSHFNSKNKRKEAGKGKGKGKGGRGGGVRSVGDMYADAFSIGHDGRGLATVNGMRLGRAVPGRPSLPSLPSLPSEGSPSSSSGSVGAILGGLPGSVTSDSSNSSHVVSWDECNAALGAVVRCVDWLAHAHGVRNFSNQCRLFPRGPHSQILLAPPKKRGEKGKERGGEGRGEGRGERRGGERGEVLEVCGPPRARKGKGGLGMGMGLLRDSSLDAALVALLTCVNDVASAIASNPIGREGREGSDGREEREGGEGVGGVAGSMREAGGPFTLPYSIVGDKICGLSIKLRFNRVDKWSEALKCLATNLKAMITHTCEHTYHT